MFRRYTYNERVDRVLRKYEISLRLIFDRLTRLKGQNAAAGIANSMVGFEAWKDFIRIFLLYDVDITERHVSLAFVWSRMKVCEERVQTAMGAHGTESPAKHTSPTGDRRTAR